MRSLNLLKVDEAQQCQGKTVQTTAHIHQHGVRLHSSQVTKVDWCLGSLPGRHDVKDCQQGSKVKLGDVRLAAGHGTFLRVEAEDAAGNTAQWTSAAITPDMTSPIVRNLTCTQAASVRRPVVRCQWTGLEERESRLGNLTVCLGSKQVGRARGWEGSARLLVVSLSVLCFDPVPPLLRESTEPWSEAR